MNEPAPTIPLLALVVPVPRPVEGVVAYIPERVLVACKLELFQERVLPEIEPLFDGAGADGVKVPLTKVFVVVSVLSNRVPAMKFAGLEVDRFVAVCATSVPKVTLPPVPSRIPESVPVNTKATASPEEGVMTPVPSAAYR